MGVVRDGKSRSVTLESSTHRIIRVEKQNKSGCNETPIFRKCCVFSEKF